MLNFPAEVKPEVGSWHPGHSCMTSGERVPARMAYVR